MCSERWIYKIKVLFRERYSTNCKQLHVAILEEDDRGQGSWLLSLVPLAAKFNVDGW